MPGRNEPCQCGSGIKHKRCCLPRIDAVGRELRARDAVLDDIVAWVRDKHAGVVEEAGRQTMLIRMLRGPVGRGMSTVWAVNDHRPSDAGPPLTARFAARADLDDGAREIVRGLSEATLDVFRVGEALSDAWIVLEPLRGGEQTTVMTDRGFAGLNIGDIVLARVVRQTSVPTVWGPVMRFPIAGERRWRALLEQLPAARAEAALALLAFHPDDAAEPLPDDVEVVTLTQAVDGDALLDALEVDPTFECLGQAIPEGWAFSWLDDADCGRADLGGWLEDDDEIETARLVVRPAEMTLASGDRETLDLLASHVEREYGALLAPARLPRAA